MKVSRLALGVCLSVLATVVFAVPAQAAPITFDFTGGTGTSYSNSSPFSMTSGGVTLTMTAWSIQNPATSTDTFDAARLARWSQGLGVCDTAEGTNCGSPQHQVDNKGGYDDYVLFYFGGVNVSLTSVTVQTLDGSQGNDRDISYWVGNLSSGNLDPKKYSDLGTFTNVDCNSCANPISIGLSGSGTYLLLGAGKADTTPDDFFKISTLKVNTSPITTQAVPEPASMLLLGTGLLGVASRARARRRKK